MLGESKLLPPERLQQLAHAFAQAHEGQEGNARAIAQWLVQQKAVTRYQAMVLLAGRTGPFFYGDYKVVERIEQGRQRGGFRAVHVASKQPVLLRFLSGPAASDAAAWQTAQRHSHKLARIVSPYVQRHFEAVDLGKFKFFVFEDVRGSSLAEQLAGGKVAPAEACRLARLVAMGLDAFHAGGRAYGDLCAPNVSLENAGTQQPVNAKVIVSRVSLAAALDLAEQQPDGHLAELADYLAPELWTPGRAPDVLSDIYALGCLLYHMLAGTAPFAGGDLQEKSVRHKRDTAPPLETLGVSKPLAQVVAYLMAKNPAVRYSTAKLAAEQLAAHIEPEARGNKPPSPPATLAAYLRAIEREMADAVQATPPASATANEVPSDKTVATYVAANLGSEPVTAVHPTVALESGTLNVQLKVAKRQTRTAEEILRLRKKQQKRNWTIALSGLVLLAAAGGGFGVWWMNRPQPAAGSLAAGGPATKGDTEPVASGEQSAGASDPASGAATLVTAGASTTGKGSGGQVVADDGKMLWASPTAGEAVTFRLVPPEAQAFLIVRPAAMSASEEGTRVLAAFGPGFASQRQTWEQEAGFKLTEIEQLIVTLHNNGGKYPRMSFVVRTSEPFTTEQLLERWGKPTTVKENEASYFAGPKWAFYVPGAADERSFVMGDTRDIKEVAGAKGAMPPLFPQIERLRRASDAERHFSLLLFPQFLFNDDGQPLFAGEMERVRGSLEWLLGDHLQAVGFSGHFGDVCFLELRMLGSLDKEPYQLAEELGQRLERVPRQLEDYFVAINPPAYWKKLAFRFPSMMGEVKSQLRLGVENDQAIANVVLPAGAAHNLVLGGELLAATAPGATAVAASSPSAAPGPMTLAEALQLRTSFSFDSQSLEFAMRDLADEVKGNLKGAPFEFAIKIIGDDLKLEGITRNQTIRDFKQENQTIADILTALVRKANPVTTVTDPKETDQKLVWVIGPDPDSLENQVVLITTRSAAASKKYALAAPFVSR